MYQSTIIFPTPQKLKKTLAADLSLSEQPKEYPGRLDKLFKQPTMDAMDTTLNSRLSMISLPDVDGKEIRFGSLWMRQPAVVVFLRHYG